MTACNITQYRTEIARVDGDINLIWLSSDTKVGVFAAFRAVMWLCAALFLLAAKLFVSSKSSAEHE